MTELVIMEKPRVQVVMHGFAGPRGPAGNSGMTEADADARYLQKTALVGANAIQVVATLPTVPDPNTIYITTT